MRGELDPGCAALIARLRAAGAPPVEALTPEQARVAMRERRPALQLPSSAAVRVIERISAAEGGHWALRVYRPAAADEAALLPALVFIHGGGWVMGDHDTYDACLRDLCAASGGVIISVEYRLAPEHRFPAALDDCAAALAWVRRSSPSLGIDATRLAIGGDSAGGNLATVVALMEADAGVQRPLVAQLLIYPVTDLQPATASYKEPRDRHLMTVSTMQWFIDHYTPNSAQRDDWRTSPLRRDDLSGLPPTLVVTAGFDPLRDEGRAYADRLSAAGVPTQYLCFERQVHNFLVMTRITPESGLLLEIAALTLRTAWRDAGTAKEIA